MDIQGALYDALQRLRNGDIGSAATVFGNICGWLQQQPEKAPIVNQDGLKLTVARARADECEFFPYIRTRIYAMKGDTPVLQRYLTANELCSDVIDGLRHLNLLTLVSERIPSRGNEDPLAGAVYVKLVPWGDNRMVTIADENGSILNLLVSKGFDVALIIQYAICKMLYEKASKELPLRFSFSEKFDSLITMEELPDHMVVTQEELEGQGLEWIELQPMPFGVNCTKFGDFGWAVKNAQECLAFADALSAAFPQVNEVFFCIVPSSNGFRRVCIAHTQSSHSTFHAQRIASLVPDTLEGLQAISEAVKYVNSFPSVEGSKNV